MVAKQSRTAHPKWAEAQLRGRWIRPHGFVRRIRDMFARQCTTFRSLQERRDRVSDSGILIVQVGGIEDGKEVCAASWEANGPEVMHDTEWQWRQVYRKGGEEIRRERGH